MAFLHISGAEPKEVFLAQQMKMTERTFGNKGSYQNKFKTLKNYEKKEPGFLIGISAILSVQFFAPQIVWLHLDT